MADSSKTEKATPKKRRDERKKGNIFFSNDAVSVAVLLSGFFVLKLTVPGAIEAIYDFLRHCMELSSQKSPTDFVGDLGDLFTSLLLAFLKAAGPVLAATVVAGVGVTFF